MGLEDSPPRLVTVLQSAYRGDTAEAAGACKAHPFILKKLLAELRVQEEGARAAPQMEHGLPSGSDLEPAIKTLASTLLPGVAQQVVGLLLGTPHFAGRSSHTIQGTKAVCMEVARQLEVLKAELGALGPQLNDYLRWEVVTTVGTTKTGKEKKTFTLTCTLPARVNSAAAAAVEQCKHRAAMLRLVLAAAQQPAAAAEQPAAEQGAAVAAGVSCAAQPVAKARVPFGAHNPQAGSQQALAGQKRAAQEEGSSENVDPGFVTPPQPAQQQATKRARQMLAVAQQQQPGSGVSRLLR